MLTVDDGRTLHGQWIGKPEKDLTTARTLRKSEKENDARLFCPIILLESARAHIAVKAKKKTSKLVERSQNERARAREREKVEKRERRERRGRERERKRRKRPGTRTQSNKV